MKRTSDEASRRRGELSAAFERGVSRADGFQALQGASWARRFKRAAALNGRYLVYLIRRLLPPESARARVFWGKRYFWGRPEHSSSMYFFGVLEHPAEVALTRYLIGALRDGDVFFDVGANYGFYALLASELIGSGFAVAFEPVPNVFSGLDKNARLTPNVRAFNLAVSDRVGELIFDQAPDSHHTGGGLAADGAEDRPAFTKIRVQSTTIDAYRAESKSNPTVLKIDVEGAEKLVIEGARRTLAEGNPTVILEVWRPPVDNRGHREAAAILLSLGYGANELASDGRLAPLDGPALEALFSSPGESVNLVFRK